MCITEVVRSVESMHLSNLQLIILTLLPTVLRVISMIFLLEKFFGQEQELLEGHMSIFVLRRYPSVDQSDPSIVVACHNVADIALPQGGLPHKNLEVFCCDSIFVLRRLLLLLKGLHGKEMQLGRIYLHLEEPKKFCCST